MGTKIKKLLIILVGSIVWSLTMIRSGLIYSFGLGLWGANGHDAIWHIALTNSLSHGSFSNPVFSGSLMQNYHLGFDLLLATLYKLTHIPISILYFQILPPIFAILIGALTYTFVVNWRKSENESLWATFAVYFGFSFGFIITFLRNGTFSGESMFWSSQSASTLLNPPFALSIIFILAGLISLQKNKYFLSIIFFGLLIQVKAYAAILVLGALFITALYQFVSKRNLQIAKIFIGSLLLNLILFLLTKNTGLAVFVWQPFWFLETMMTYSDRLGWDRFYSAMTTYKMGHIWLKAIAAYGVAFIIFIVGNMGLRILGFSYFINIFQRKIKIDYIIIFISSILLLSLVPPMFFVQSGTPWNTIQFFYYFLFFSSILAGISINQILNQSKKIMKLLLLSTIVLFSIIGSWTTLQHYLPAMPQAIIPTKEYEALQFLSTQPDGVVLTYPFDADKAKLALAPRPLYLYDSTAYVSAISKKEVFLEDEVNLNITGYDWQKRKIEILDWHKERDLVKAREFLIKNKIRYVYWLKDQHAFWGDRELGLIKIFDNKVSIIYRYDENISSH